HPMCGASWLIARLVSAITSDSLGTGGKNPSITQHTKSTASTHGECAMARMVSTTATNTYSPRVCLSVPRYGHRRSTGIRDLPDPPPDPHTSHPPPPRDRLAGIRLQESASGRAPPLSDRTKRCGCAYEIADKICRMPLSSRCHCRPLKGSLCQRLPQSTLREEPPGPCVRSLCWRSPRWFCCSCDRSPRTPQSPTSL